MKKYGLLTILTIIASVAVILFGQTVKNSIPKVWSVKLEPLTVENVVKCSGSVVSEDENDVYVPVSAYSEKIFVKEGDQVEAGDSLMDISIPDSSQNYDNVEYDGAYEAYSAYLNQSASAPVPTTTTKLLKAPVSGKVKSISVTEPGYYVDPGKPAIVIERDNGVQVKLNVNENQISDIQTGQKVQITGVGFKYSIYFGTVTDIAEQAKQIASTSGKLTVVEVTVAVENPGGDIKPGFTAEARITVSQDTNIVLAPYDCVLAEDDGQEYVYRIQNGKALKTPIVTGKELDNGFEVVTGLSPGDRIIEKPENITDGAVVLVIGTKTVDAHD